MTMNDGYINRPGPNQWYSPPWEVGNGTGNRGASSVLNQGSFVNESWQDGISRRIHHGCNDEELAEARYHHRTREQARQAGQQVSASAPAPSPPVTQTPAKTREKISQEIEEKRAQVRAQREETERREWRASMRQAAKNIRPLSAQDARFADDFNQKMEEQKRLARRCAESANVGGYTDTDGSSVDFVDIPAYQKCVASGGMPMVRLNVPQGQTLRYDKQEKNVAIDRLGCFVERSVDSAAYATAAGAGAFLFAKDHCPKNTFYPACVASATVGAGLVNGYRGWRDAGSSSACQPESANEQGGGS